MEIMNVDRDTGSCYFYGDGHKRAIQYLGGDV